jgi:protoporphyrinogen IX oxidase
MVYEWLKAGHIIAMVAWMAGLFYLPRLLVYHADAAPGSDKSETFKVMERRLISVIMKPAMIATWLLGLALAWLGNWWSSPWFIAKVCLVLVLTGFDAWLTARSREFADDANTWSPRAYRIANEVPTILLIAIVLLVVIKPFQ